MFSRTCGPRPAALGELSPDGEDGNRGLTHVDAGRGDEFAVVGHHQREPVEGRDDVDQGPLGSARACCPSSRTPPAVDRHLIDERLLAAEVPVDAGRADSGTVGDAVDADPDRAGLAHQLPDRAQHHRAGAPRIITQHASHLVMTGSESALPRCRRRRVSPIPAANPPVSAAQPVATAGRIGRSPTAGPDDARSSLPLRHGALHATSHRRAARDVTRRVTPRRRGIRHRATSRPAHGPRHAPGAATSKSASRSGSRV